MVNMLHKLCRIKGAYMTHPFDGQISEALGANIVPSNNVKLIGDAAFPSWFDVSDLAIASVSAAASEASAVLGARSVTLDRRRALMWFNMTLRPIGWGLPASWDPIAGDYAASDGWIKLHTNAPHHRDAALSVLRCNPSRGAVAEAVNGWKKTDLETAIVQAQGCAAAMHSLSEWSAHPQGRSVALEPLIAWENSGATGRPVLLENLHVLDLTRVLAGPVATRFLAGYGATVLRIDPPNWNEPGIEPEVTLGKKCAGLDLKTAEDRNTFEGLLKKADVLVHGYRSGALDGLGYAKDQLRQLSPELIEVSLNAYGHTGPWSHRRGFDSLVQMSGGIADEGMRQGGKSQPFPLPVQALDHATGYLMAATVLRALRIRQQTGQIMTAQLSLARTAALLTSAGVHHHVGNLHDETSNDLTPEVEETGWGRARRLKFPVDIEDHPVRWRYPSGPLRRVEAKW